MPSPCQPISCCPLSDRVAPAFVEVVSPPLGCRIFLSYGLEMVEAVDMLCPGSFHFSHIADYIYDFCPLPDPDVGQFISV